MSLINDVLRDLQSGDRAPLVAHGLEAVRRERRWLRWVKFAGVFALGTLVASAWYYWVQSDQVMEVKDTEQAATSLVRPASRPGPVADLTPEPTQRQAAPAETVLDAGAKPAAVANRRLSGMVETETGRSAAKDSNKGIREKGKNAEAAPDGASGYPAEQTTTLAQESPAAEAEMSSRDSEPSSRIQKTADSADSRAERIRAQAQRFIRRGRLRQALPLLAQAAQLIPADESIYRLRAGVLQRLNQPVAADRALQQGLEAIPRSTTLLEARARLHLASGDIDGAIRVLRADPEKIDVTPDLAGLLAGLLQRTRRFAEALEIYRKLGLVEHAHPSWWLGLAISLEQTGNAEQAATAYRNALAAGLSGSSQAYARERLGALVPAKP